MPTQRELPDQTSEPWLDDGAVFGARRVSLSEASGPRNRLSNSAFTATSTVLPDMASAVEKPDQTELL
jgi:hypothetical protein